MFITPTLNSIVLTTTPLDEIQAFNIHDMHKLNLVGEKRFMVNRYTILIDANFTPALAETILEPISRSPGTSRIYIHGPVPQQQYDLINSIVNTNVAEYQRNIAYINRNYDNDENSW